MYETYSASGEEDFKVFYQNYDPPIQPNKHTCVGLAMVVLNGFKDLERDFPGITDAMMLVSCDESVQESKPYARAGGGPQSFLVDTEKDHSLVACHVLVDGRPGVFLSDLGYHVARAITAMRDRHFPHTGWFVQTERLNYRKEYGYEMCLDNSNYIEWHVRETRSDRNVERLAMVYVAQEYLSAVAVTEKRNLVWIKKSMVARNSMGQLTAGVNLICRKDELQLYIFEEDVNFKQRNKIDLDTFLEMQNVPEEFAMAVRECSARLNMQEGELMDMLRRLVTILNNSKFIAEMLEINERIVQVAASKQYCRR